MEVHTSIPLKKYLTMQLGGHARFMTDVSTPDEMATAIRNAHTQSLPVFILGGGSNTIAQDHGFSGLVIRNKIMGFEITEDNPNETTLKIGAGENWDEIVRRTVDMGLSGIEAMSAIPGTCGAAPVQNIGAYGQEVADVLISIEAYDSTDDAFVTLQNNECGFSYRHSMFRGNQAGRYAITSITLKLSKNAPAPPFYDALQRYFEASNITFYTAQVVRDAVTAIRSDKLPDPNVKPNTGSFFKNAIIDTWQLDDLRKKWPTIPSYELGDKRVKIPTGWLIEQTGLKGKLLHGMRVHEKNCLVLINESAQSYSDLAAARSEVQAAVRDTFGILIEQEPLELA